MNCEIGMILVGGKTRLSREHNMFPFIIAHTLENLFKTGNSRIG